MKTRAEVAAGVLEQTADVCRRKENPVCRLRVTGYSEEEAWLAIALRPFNLEGVSFIEKIEVLKDENGWLVNGKETVWFDQAADVRAFSDYRQGDVARKIPKSTDVDSVICNVGMATAAGVPVVALDVTGVRDVIQNGKNGYLLEKEDSGQFAAALSWCLNMDQEERRGLVREARKMRKRSQSKNVRKNF